MRRAWRSLVVVSVAVAGFVAVAPASAAATGSLTGWVTDAQGVAGVPVRAYTASGAVAATTATDSDGDFRFAALKPASYRVCADGKNVTNGRAPLGYVAACWRDARELAGAEPVVVTAGSTQDVTISVSAAAILTGHVRDTAGNALAAVPVQVNGLTTTTDATGLYRIRVPATNVTVCATGGSVAGPTSQVGYLNGCYRNGVYFTASSSATTYGVDVALRPAAGISGRVVDQAGSALAHVEVGAAVLGGLQTQTDADGRYTIRGLDPRFQGEVHFDTSGATGGASRTGYVDTCYGGTTCRNVPLTSGADVTGINATVHWAGELHGEVVDRHGRGVTGLRIYLDGYPVASPGADGSWQILRVTPGDRTVCFRDTGSVTAPDADGYQDACWKNQRLGHPTPITVHSGASVTGVDVVVTGNGRISGRVVDAAGHPVTGAEVTWSDSGSAAAPGSGTTAADGSYLVGGLEVGSYSVCVDTSSATPTGLAPACSSATVTVTDNATARAADFVVRAASSVQGTVTDDSGTPLFGVEVTVDRVGSSTSWRAETAGDGSYRVGDLPPGTYTVCFDPRFAFPTEPNGARKAQCFDDVEGTASPTPVVVDAGSVVTGIDATLHLQAVITGTVTDKIGNPLQNVEIELDGTELVESDLQGRYTIQDPTPGSHILCFRGGGAASASTRGFQDVCWKNRTPSQTPTPLVVPAHRTVVADAKLPVLRR